MSTIRERMIESGDNLSWCRPYISEDESIKFAVNENGVCGMIVDGRDIDFDNYDVEVSSAVKRLCKEFEGDELNALRSVCTEVGCCECPFFMECDAMEDP